jgi:type I restriction enzyme S subunit
LAPAEILPARVNQHVSIIRPTKEKVGSAFLRYLLISKDYKDRLLHTGEGGGSTRQAITKAQLQELAIRYPELLSEQQRIVGTLDEAFESIATVKANAEKNRQNASAIFESHLQSVFTKRGPGWDETTLEKVLTVQPQNGWSPPAANHSDSGTPVLTLSSVTGFRFRPDKIKFTSASVDPRRHYWVKNGDFLITRSNTPELVGHVAIASGISKPTIYPDLIMRMNPAPDRMMTEFLYYQMRSSLLRKEITGRAQGANPTMKKISNGAVRTLPISVPSIATQRAIVETLNGLTEETQSLASLYERKLAALEMLKNSLLHQAFTEKL